MIAPVLEEYVSAVFLAAHRDSAAYVRRADVAGAAAIEAAEAPASAAVATVAQAATPEAVTLLVQAQRRREEAVAAPRETVVRFVTSGRTSAQTWHVADVHERRGLLAANYAAVIIRPGKRSHPRPQRRARGARVIGPARRRR